MGVVTLARMVKLLLTVRRLANTWGMDGQRRRREEEEGEREGRREGNSGRVEGGGGQVHCTSHPPLSGLLQQLKCQRR